VGADQVPILMIMAASPMRWRAPRQSDALGSGDHVSDSPSPVEPVVTLPVDSRSADGSDGSVTVSASHVEPPPSLGRYRYDAAGESDVTGHQLVKERVGYCGWRSSEERRVSGQRASPIFHPCGEPSARRCGVGTTWRR
jgi:hypothetical protein